MKFFVTCHLSPIGGVVVPPYENWKFSFVQRAKRTAMSASGGAYRQKTERFYSANKRDRTRSGTIRSGAGYRACRKGKRSTLQFWVIPSPVHTLSKSKKRSEALERLTVPNAFRNLRSLVLILRTRCTRSGANPPQKRE